ncbi:MAG TPA: 23S rRNA (pseudouridine(1915)-N(3))-methyltransferase RlmH [Rhizobiales bacterium]|nr:23S rRNA (pseudouridine(1915)-N(3))-methyltransferase RlmH [Hyphomicrobiales bacterium]
MRIHIGAIGRLKKSPEHVLATDYIDRIGKTGRPAGISRISVKEYPESQAASAELRKNDEATRLLAGCPPQSLLIVLDEHGRQFSSIQLAKQIGRAGDDGVQDLAFLIGGPDGHADSLLEAAKIKMSFGAMTWPHRLVRIMLAEQIYRSVTILLNHPYHRS